MNGLAALYPWLKALHIVAVIAWMAGLLYLPRLFVYHCDAPPGSSRSATFILMERRLLRGIMTPAMLVAFPSGIGLSGWPGVVDWSAGWIWIKLLCVLGLVVLHGLFSRWRRDFSAGSNRHGQRFYRWINEIPALLLVVIVVMVVVRPF